MIGRRVANQVLQKSLNENEKKWLQVEVLHLFYQVILGQTR